ncbi:hypothetical protein Hypma_006338 [Hypsizygus marmoreus]|uniref:Uncharacterized protein n=1 Tax=Hypsizygus marmoreus TaxID=39966 RepID=A0A369JWF2_HYPMA|nr:hypothetical protein Hypma_006338 [Hypsizygus marmoreus]
MKWLAVARYVADCSNLEFERDALKSRVDRYAVRTEHAQTVSEKDQLLRYATQAIIALEATGAKCANDLRDMTMLRDMALNEKTESEAKYQDRIREATEMISYGLEMSRQCMDALPRFENGREPGLPLILRSSARDAFLGF